MDLSKIPTGANPPYDVNAIIEIPQGGEPVKYELEKESGAIFVDRFLHTAMFYPGNYGFIPHTLADDGDPMDILVVGPTPVVPGAVIRCRPVGALMMRDEAGGDEKVLADHRAGNHRRRADHQDVHRIAVVGERVRDEAVVAGIEHRRVQEAVDEDRAGLLFQLVLHRLAALRDLDDGVDVVRRVRAGRDFGEVHEAFTHRTRWGGGGLCEPSHGSREALLRCRP